jgi:hypothetical protein
MVSVRADGSMRGGYCQHDGLVPGLESSRSGMNCNKLRMMNQCTLYLYTSGVRRRIPLSI